MCPFCTLGLRKQMQSTEERLVELFIKYRVEFRRAGENKHVRPGWVGVSCPMCGDNGDFHMGINLRYLYGSCWLCGKHSFYDIVTAIGRFDWADVKPIKEDLALTSRPFDNKRRGKYRPPADLHPLTDRHLRYLRDERRIDVDADWFPAYGLKSVGFADAKYKFRIFMPVTLGLKEVSFTTRSTLKTGVRYLSAAAENEEVSHKELLFGEDFVRSTIMVHEGPMDAMAVGPGAVATFGTSYSKQQLYRIARYPKRYICFDTEPIAQRRAERLADDLSMLPGLTFNLVINAKDAGAAGEGERAKLRALLT